MGILAPARGSYREDLCQSASEAIARRGTPPAPIDLLNVKAQPTRRRVTAFSEPATGSTSALPGSR